MSDILPQQQLLLELIMMSGDVTVPKNDDGTMIYRTLKECSGFGWVSVLPGKSNSDIATVTAEGRKAI